MKNKLIFVISLALVGVLAFPIPATAGLFGPNCKKVHPIGIRLMNDIAKYYPVMMAQKNRGDYSKAYSSYKLLNKKNNQLNDLMNSDKNYRCFLDADFEKSSYKWQSEYPGRSFGGTVKSLCVLWGVGCKPANNYYSNPCDQYTLTRDYQDCIEDHARPTDPGFVD